MSKSKRFSKITPAPPVEVYDVYFGHMRDTFEKKVNLGIGAYRTDEGKPWVLPVVRNAEKQIANDLTLNHEYLNPLGLEEFTGATISLLLGQNSPALSENRAIAIQCLSGTGSLRMGAEFLAKILKYSVFYYSIPTWGNHTSVFLSSGFKEGRTYRYYSDEKRGIDIEGLLEDLRNAPKNSVVILQCCGHNPTGCDLAREEWIQIADVIEEKNLFPFLDTAYLGFASGDFDEDAWPVRYFVQRGFEFFCAQSFSKNFGLYNERVGNLVMVLDDSEAIVAVKGHFTTLVRAMYSDPPHHGARVVAHILNSPELYDQWKDNLLIMTSRLKTARRTLYNELQKLKTPGTWEHLITQLGMFSYTGMNEKQSIYMTKKYHIYMLKSGRISVCGINPSNVEYIAKAIHDTVSNIS